MTSFKHTFIANRADKFVTILSNCATEGVTKAQLFRSLGLCLSQCPPPAEQQLSVLTGSWKTINTFTHVAEYVACVEPWAQYTAMNFDVSSIDKVVGWFYLSLLEIDSLSLQLREVNTFLGDVLSRLNQNRAFENHYTEMYSIVDKIVTHTKSFEGLLISVSRSHCRLSSYKFVHYFPFQDHFLPLIDLCQKESIKLDVCKNIMTACKNKSESVLNDAVVINALMYICKVLNDAVK